MKVSNLMTAATLSALLTVSSTTQAAPEVSTETEAKQAGVMVGSFVTGGIAGGPLGAIAGFLAGVWMSEQVKTADSLDAVEQQLSAAQQQADQFAAQLSDARQANQQMAQAALDQLQLALLFKTGEGALTAEGEQRLAYLADFLVKNPTISVRLDGFADPRGSEPFNLALSEQRVQSVAATLNRYGVAEQRIDSFSHGASQSSAAVGDYDAYALERVVKIQLQRVDSLDTMAQVLVAQ